MTDSIGHPLPRDAVSSAAKGSGAGTATWFRVWVLVIWGMLVLLALLVDRLYYTEQLRESRSQVEVDLGPSGNALTTALNRRQGLLESLVVYVNGHLLTATLDSGFEPFAAGLHGVAGGIRAVQLAPDGVIRYLYPLAGNEPAMGLNLLTDERPQVRSDVQRVLSMRQVILSGPYELRQGGMGVVMRQAVVHDDKVWGLAAMVFDVPPILAEAGLTGRHLYLRWALRDSVGSVFQGDQSVFTQKPVVFRVLVPDGSWELAAVPEAGWRRMAGDRAMGFRVALGIVVLLLGLVSYLVVSRQGSLALAVTERTRQIMAINEDLQRQIAERKRMEAQLLNAQKMEALGRLAGGVAHDFNNILAVIVGYSESLSRRLAEDDPLRSSADEIGRAADRGVGLTRQLLTFGKQHSITHKPQDLNRVINELKPMLRAAIARGIEMDIDLAASPWQIEADRGQVEQVLMNLAINARDAMGLSGTLTITTANVELNDGTASAMSLTPGEYVELSVRDTGCGIDPETQQRIFDPFFTTKGVKGTGLGLSIVYTIVQQSGGCVHVASQPGQGACFEVYFPRSKALTMGQDAAQ